MGAVFLLRRQPGLVSRFGVGVFFTLLAMALKSGAEWEFRATQIFLLMHIIVGVLAAVYSIQTADNTEPATRGYEAVT